MNQYRAYAQLVRLPNLPTALADILLGFDGRGVGDPDVPLGGLAIPYLLLMAASACLYCGGMAWNDFFDREEDKRERPERPIPSGRMAPRQAALFAAGLTAAGAALAFLAGLTAAAWVAPTVLAGMLIGAIFLYDAWLKHTVVGPVGMGACRFLNVLLAVSPAAELLQHRGFYLAMIVGLYIVGVTWLARTEARVSSRGLLLAAASVMLFSLLIALPLPVLPTLPGVGSGPPQAPPADASSPLFPYLLVGLGFFVGLPVAAAIRSPTPDQVQAAVKRSLMGLILLDAVLASSMAGSAGLLLALLLAPSVYLNRRRWLYAT